jgi:cytochrome c oxidase subunit 2
MFYAAVQHRKPLGHQAAHFHENTAVEMIWTVIPFLILIGMAWPATKTVLDDEGHANPDLTVKVTGYQWKWEYDYLQDGVKFTERAGHAAGADREQGGEGEELPAGGGQPPGRAGGQEGAPADHSNDVIHAWWVQELGVKQDAIPGFVRDTWFRAESPEPTAASAPSCAARTTASCPSWSR